ncbi:hypothetical protein EN780_06420 [Mesorhizobium sp. M4B.F.Ca.ET.089.01.1.1]|uniref:hypothetical protein n=1 Tax=Mesorhizobium sp. M4B.F.Ca.ET.089.01.1.1 TaxID=2496662 RepID=UPI000FE2C510|nr:hypothetical protein [Mesorhizobium sp. M4B.F.Ca.ET.089.01.1.1]RWX69388.1 hypothetical protein EN780_06420 [Mesorhizobium sp. M4B.F.Ca.ET.089.01.1.1]
MKVKMDFVSNSSSTSFVYIAKEMLSKQDFLDAAGVSADSPLASLFEEMFYQIKSGIERGDTLHSLDQVDELEGRHDFTPEVLDRMRKALEQGQTVTTGHLSSEESLAESVLCMEIFEIESERFYINAYDNYW